MPIQKITSGILDTSSVFSSPTITTPTISAPIVSGNLSLDSTGTTGVRAPSANTLAFHTAGTEDMRIDSSGRVGIGQTSPTSGCLLDVKGGDIRAENTSGSIRLRLVGGSNQYSLETSSGTNALQFIDAAAGLERMRIDSAGRVTKPYHPYFNADRSSNQTGFNATSTGDVVIIYNNTSDNVGNHFNTSTGKFTAPVAGIYIFQASAYINYNSGQSWLVINGNRAGYADWSLGTSGAFTIGFWVVKLAANDSVGYHPYSGSETNGTIFSAANHTYFRGYLVG